MSTGKQAVADQQERDTTFISSLFHGLAVLEAIAESTEDMPLSKLAVAVSLQKTNTWRLAHTLVRLGYLHQDEETRRFSLSPRVMALGYAYLERLDLRELAAPFLRDLSEQTREMVNLAIQDGEDLVFIDRVRTSHIVNINLHPGSHLPLYNTSLGRVLISESPQAWLKQYISNLSDDPRAVKYTQNGAKRLLQMLKDVRDRGYALSDNERVQGLQSVAAPIRNRNGKIIAALNILIPSVRVTTPQLRQVFAPKVMNAATLISAALGYKWRQVWRARKAGAGL
jgi:IclR family pca regulon transcriptional regulator